MTRVTYSVKLKDALDELRPSFREVSQGLDALTKRRADLAPAFTRAYRLWQRETKKPLIAFVHELDPSMPVGDRKAYRKHASYRSAEYLLHLVEGEEKAGPRGKTPLAMLALTIKTLLPLSHPHQKDTLAVLMHATGWRDRDQTKLLGRIQRVRAAQLPQLPRLVKASQTAEASKAAVIAFQRDRVA